MSSKESEFSITHDSQATQQDVTWCTYKGPCERHTCVCHHYANKQRYMTLNNKEISPTTNRMF